MMSRLPLSSFLDIVLKVLSHEIFARFVTHLPSNSAYMHNRLQEWQEPKKKKPRSFTSSTTFVNTKSPSTFSGYCQLCDKEGQLAKHCWNFLKLKKKQSTNLDEAFSACSIEDLITLNGSLTVMQPPT
jgi:hypothetical protein